MVWFDGFSQTGAKTVLPQQLASADMPGHTAYRARVNCMTDSPPVQQNAKPFYTNLHIVCKKIVGNKVHAVKG